MTSNLQGLRVQAIVRAAGEAIGDNAEQLERMPGLRTVTLVIELDRNSKPRIVKLRTEQRHEVRSRITT